MKESIIKATKKDLKFFHIETSIKSSKERTIKGFASTKFPDRVNDVVLPSALAASMNLYMKNPLVLLDHDHSQPIGLVKSWQITEDGLWVESKIGNTDLGDKAWTEIEQGLRRAFSIGFIPREIDWSKDSPEITELELLEISVVTIPANRESLFSIAKALESGTDLREKAAQLFGWAKTRAEFSQLADLIERHFTALPSEEKIFIESRLLELHNRINGIESDAEAEKISVEVEILNAEIEFESL